MYLPRNHAKCKFVYLEKKWFDSIFEYYTKTD